MSELRFAFGRNWRSFLSRVDEARIGRAVASLRQMLERDSLSGMNFLDVGSGSGLFSLAARRLGAKVTSFDYDPDSVEATKTLKARFAPDDGDWNIAQGSALDRSYLQSLGSYDVVYSWGVLHHTGDMWQALENVDQLVAEGGQLFIAIYNDQGPLSRMWHGIKKFYNGSGPVLRALVLTATFAVKESISAVARAVTLRNPLPFSRWRMQGEERGMSLWHDHIDWVGGYPFEVAKPEGIFDFYRKRGYRLDKLVTRGGGWGCCEYVFSKTGDSRSAKQ